MKEEEDKKCGLESTRMTTHEHLGQMAACGTLSARTKCKVGAMEGTWRTIATLILSLLQIQALAGVKTPLVGVEGQRFNFRCDYPDSQQSNAKYFCHVEDNKCSDQQLIQTNKHNQWVKDQRYSLFDNTNGSFFTVSVDNLTLEDSGSYCCGVDVISLPDHVNVVELVVSKAPSTNSPNDFHVDKLNLPLYLTAVMCVSAILCVCLFTLCLLLVVKQRSSSPRNNRQSSSDYETMAPGVTPEPEPCCTCSDPNCADDSFLPPPDLYSHFTDKQRDSVVTLSHCEYEDLDVSGHICHYQHLDLKQLEDNVYHCFHGDNKVKDGHLGDKEHNYS